jgi:hypothetical protein
MKCYKVDRITTVDIILDDDTHQNDAALRTVASRLPASFKNGSITGASPSFPIQSVIICYHISRQRAVRITRNVCMLPLESLQLLTRPLVSYPDQEHVNNHKILRLSWASRSFIEDDTTQSAIHAGSEMFPDGKLFATVPSVGSCLIILSKEEMAALDSVQQLTAEHSSECLLADRCQMVLTVLLLQLARGNVHGFRGLPIDIFFNSEDDGNPDSAPSLKFTGWPNLSRLHHLREDDDADDPDSESFELQPPYVPNNAEEFNPVRASPSSQGELAALTVNSLALCGPQPDPALSRRSAFPRAQPPISLLAPFATTYQL